MSSIGFSGLGSGLPIDDIIKATIAAEAVPLKRMQADKTFAQEQISAYGSLTSRLESLRSAMSKLKGEDKFELVAAKSSNETAFTATADHRLGATAGNYSVEVIRKAESYRWVSDHVPNADANAATYTGTITIAGVTLNVGTPELDGDGNPTGTSTPWTLDQVRQAINDNTTLKSKVSANIINEGGTSRLVINSRASGEDGRLAEGSVNLTNIGITKDVDKSTEDDDKLDAEITIDGINATSSTNTFTDVISGVTISLGADATAGQTGTLNVARDDGSIKDRIDEFVKAYNDVVIHLNEARKGPLASEGVVRSVEGILRDTLFTPTGGNGDLQNTLASIGITSFVQSGWEPGEERSSRNGTLEIDRTKLDQMLSEDFEKVAFIFGNEETGYAARIEQAARQLTSDTVIDGQIAKGLISTRRSGLTAQIGRIDDRIAATDMRLELMEARLYKQFNAVDAMTANFNFTGNYIAQQMENLPGYTRK